MVLNISAQASNPREAASPWRPTSGGGPTLRPITATREVDPGDRTTRSTRAPVDRGGRRLVRVPRGDPVSVCPALQGGRAVGVGPAFPAPPCDQDQAREAPPGRRSGLIRG